MQSHAWTRFCVYRHGRDVICNAGVHTAKRFVYSCRTQDMSGHVTNEVHVSRSYQDEHCVYIRSPDALN